MESIDKQGLCNAFRLFNSKQELERSQVMWHNQALITIEKEEKKPGYAGVLYELYRDSPEIDIRLVSLICLKNVVKEVFSGLRRSLNTDSRCRSARKDVI